MPRRGADGADDGVARDARLVGAAAPRGGAAEQQDSRRDGCRDRGDHHSRPQSRELCATGQPGGEYEAYRGAGRCEGTEAAAVHPGVGGQDGGDEDDWGGPEDGEGGASAWRWVMPEGC